MPQLLLCCTSSLQSLHPRLLNSCKLHDRGIRRSDRGIRRSGSGSRLTNGGRWSSRAIVAKAIAVVSVSDAGVVACVLCKGAPPRSAWVTEANSLASSSIYFCRVCWVTAGNAFVTPSYCKPIKKHHSGIVIFIGLKDAATTTARVAKANPLRSDGIHL